MIQAVDRARTSPLRRDPPREALVWVADSVGRGATVTSVMNLPEGGWHANHVVTVEHRGQTHELILRRWARPQWAEADPDFTAEREARVLRLLAAIPLRTPNLIAVDPEGSVCDVPAILTDRLPGAPPRPVITSMDSFLTQLAEALPKIHALDGEELPAYRRYYASFDSYVPPDWATQPDLWTRAAEITRRPPPAVEQCLIHRDYHPGNTLWQGGRLAGVVDWTSASRGAPAVDTAHMRWNLAIAHGAGAAERFLDVYRSISAATEGDQHYWDLVTVLDVIAELNPDELPPNWRLDRLEHYVEGVLARVK